MFRKLSILWLCGCSAIASSGDFEFEDVVPMGCQDSSECEVGPQQSADCVDTICVTSCVDGFGNCDGLEGNGCEADLASSVSTCGTCETACVLADALPACTAGTCGVESCLGTNEDCDGDAANGCEANLNSPAHCLGCDLACSIALPFCQVEDGTRRCVEECSEGLSLCDGMTCADTMSDIDHCGTCGEACAGENATWLCSAGACEVDACLAGYFDCDGDSANGCEVDGREDVFNCGACENACEIANAEAACSASECVLVACELAFADCDANLDNGCEVDTRTDVQNCDRCGEVCEGGAFEWTCSAGSCETGMCTVGLQDCDNDGLTCETDITTSLTHCGMCDQACIADRATSACDDRVCAIDMCDAGVLDCDDAYSNGCEVDPLSNDAHCGGCDSPCDAGSSCIAGMCERRVLTGALGAQHGCAILADDADAGEIYCWGQDGEGTLAQGVVDQHASEARIVPGPSGGNFHASALAASDASVCAIVRNAVGEVYCWGDGAGYVLGQGDETDSPEPLRVTGDAAFDAADLVQVEAYGQTICARSAAGELWCWGDNAASKILGGGAFEGTPLDQGFDGSTPAQSVTDVSVGSVHVCVVLGDATVRCWGDASATLGDPAALGPIVQPMGLPSITSVQVDEHTCALGNDGSVWCWGDNAFGEIGDGSTTLRTTPVQAMGFDVDPATSVAVGPDHSCAQTATGIFCWGRASRGALGNASLGGPVALPTRIDDLPANSALGSAVSLFGAYGSTCALRGTQVPVCWGSAAGGALTRGAIVAPAVLDGDAALQSSTDVAAGVNAGCSASGGRLYCWGRNVDDASPGQFITGRSESSEELEHHDPLTVLGVSDVQSVELAREFGCVLDGAGAVHCWGVGDPDAFLGGAGSTPMPVAVALPGPASMLSLGDRHACALYDNGGVATVSCWGRSSAGETGQVAGSSHAPFDVALGACVPMQLSAGGATSCVVCEDGSALCWGKGDEGQLGNGALASTEVPTAVVGLTNVSLISVGFDHVCALANENVIATHELYCWGNGSRGALGNASTTSAPLPSEVLGMDGATALLTGYQTSCGILGADAYCWGAGDWGLYGGAVFNADMSSPQRVPMPSGSDPVALRSASFGGTDYPKTYYALREDGSVVAWGWNVDGAASTSPVYVSTATPLVWSGL